MDKSPSPADLLKEIISESGLTQLELSRMLDTTPVSINSWINSKSTPRSKALDQIQTLYFETVGSDIIDPNISKQTIKTATALESPLPLLIQNKDTYDDVLVEFTYNTNSIEGSTMTHKDTREVLLENAVLTNRTQAELLEAKNHQATYLWLLDRLSKGVTEFTHDLIQELNKQLMHGIHSNAGQYRTVSVRIHNSRTVTANPASIATNLDELLIILNKRVKKEYVIEHLAQTHASFEQIHPFEDGNGRTGRLLLLASAIVNNAMIPLVKRTKRAAYYSYLEQAQTKEKYAGLEFFIASCMLDMKKVINS